jgi:hypothetical protein
MSRYRDLWSEALADAYGELYELYIAEHPDASDEEVFDALVEEREFRYELHARAERRMQEATREMRQ